MMEYIKFLNDGKDGDLCGFIVEQLDKNRVFVVKGQEDRIVCAIARNIRRRITSKRTTIRRRNNRKSQDSRQFYLDIYLCSYYDTRRCVYITFKLLMAHYDV